MNEVQAQATGDARRRYMDGDLEGQFPAVVASVIARDEQRYVYPVQFDTELQKWVPRDVGTEDDALPASRSRKTIEQWERLYPNDQFAVLPRFLEDVWEVDPHELYEDPVAHQATLAEAEYRRLKARQDAERRVASDNYRGTREVSWADFLAQPDTEWLVDGLIGRGTLNYLVARANLGKSFTYLDMALSMATGNDWHDVPTHGERVMLVIGEGFSQFHKRVTAWCVQHEIDPLTLAHNFVVFDGANLNNEESLGILSARAAEFNPDLIVFDTWAQTSGLSDEDKAALSSATLSAARTVSPDAALLFVAHPTKSSEDTTHPILRGSGATFGASDNVLTMFADTQHETGLDRKYLAISTESAYGGKSRDAEQVTMRGFYLESVEQSAVLLRDDSEALSKADRWVQKHLAKFMPLGEAMSAKDIEEASGQSARSIERYLPQAESVTRTKDGRAYVYTRTADKAKRKVDVSAADNFGKAA